MDELFYSQFEGEGNRVKTKDLFGLRVVYMVP